MSKISQHVYRKHLSHKGPPVGRNGEVLTSVFWVPETDYNPGAARGNKNF